MFRSYIPAVIRSIEKVEPKLHRIQLSGKYDYKMIEEKIGKLKVDEDYQPEKRNKNYSKRAFRQMSNGTILRVYYNPIQSYRPWSLIEFTYPKKEDLEELNEAFPDLTVSFVEYAVDLFCKRYPHGEKQSYSIEQLLFFLRKNIYCPYQRSIRRKGEDVLQIGTKREINSFLGVGKVKVYERGPDNKKKESCWHYTDVDRVRLEYRANKDDLLKNGIRALKDFIKDPKFKNIYQSVYDFRRFKGKQVDDDFHKSLMEEIIERREKGIKNVTQYLERVQEWEPLKRKILLKIDEFNYLWTSSIIYVESLCAPPSSPLPLSVVSE